MDEVIKEANLEKLKYIKAVIENEFNNLKVYDDTSKRMQITLANYEYNLKGSLKSIDEIINLINRRM